MNNNKQIHDLDGGELPSPRRVDLVRYSLWRRNGRGKVDTENIRGI